AAFVVPRLAGNRILEDEALRAFHEGEGLHPLERAHSPVDQVDVALLIGLDRPHLTAKAFRTLDTRLAVPIVDVRPALRYFFLGALATEKGEFEVSADAWIIVGV